MSANPDPITRPVMVQRWDDVVFLHWRYEPAEVQRLLPAGVEVDTFDGSAWVALVPFHMRGLGFPGGLAPLPYVGSFPEINVRTYVRSGDKRGVWFFSLDVNKVLPTATARIAYDLPYCYGAAHHERVGDIVTSRVDRRWPRPAHGPATTEIVVRTGEPTDPSAPLPEFLTARWGLIAASRRGKLAYAPVDHPPWPLHTAELLHLDDHLIEAAGLSTPEGEPHVMWSPSVPVKVSIPRRIR